MIDWATPQALVVGTTLLFLAGVVGMAAIRGVSAGRPRHAAQLRAALIIVSGFLLLTLWMVGALAGHWVVLPAVMMGLWSIRRTVEDTVAGALVFVSRPIERGDIIEVADVRGEVTKVGVRALVLRSADGADIRMPYHLVLAGPLLNHHHATADIPIEVDLPLMTGPHADQLARAAMCAATSPYASLHRRPETFLKSAKNGSRIWIRVRGYVFDSTFAEELRSHIVEAWLEADDLDVEVSYLDVPGL